ncbi:MAG: fatty acid desaturase [Alphaproteobacteria bacterium]
MLAATGYGIVALWGSWWAVPLYLANGAVMWGLGYAGQHELIHRTAFRTRWVNDALAHLPGFLRFFPSDYQRAWHFVHHRYTKDPERDSELIGTPPWTLGRYLWFLTGLGYWRARLATLARFARGRVDETYYTDRERVRLARETRCYIAGYAVVLALVLLVEPWALVMLWPGPLLATTPFFQFYTAAEHHGRPNVRDMFENTRTTRTGPVIRWIMWNMPYHTEHHLFPGVPFHALPALCRELRESATAKAESNVIARGYFAVHRELVRGLLRRDPVFALS